MNWRHFNHIEWLHKVTPTSSKINATPLPNTTQKSPIARRDWAFFEFVSQPAVRAKLLSSVEALLSRREHADADEGAYGHKAHPGNGRHGLPGAELANFSPVDIVEFNEQVILWRNQLHIVHHEVEGRHALARPVRREHCQRVDRRDGHHDAVGILRAGVGRRLFDARLGSGLCQRLTVHSL